MRWTKPGTIIGAIILSLACVANAVAAPVEIRVAYLEPTTRTSGEPLDNLANTNIVITQNDEPIGNLTVEAVSPSGGAKIVRTFASEMDTTIDNTFRGCVDADDTNGQHSEQVCRNYVVKAVVVEPPPTTEPPVDDPPSAPSGVNVTVTIEVQVEP